jgi:mannose/cellobiose epimerase-like protein (N-acyl-D-glucosamine 2-epimerase family)
MKKKLDLYSKSKRKDWDSDMDYVKANRKGSRDAELENDGKFKATTKVHTSKKKYDRKRNFK